MTLKLTLGCGDYDRTAALRTGEVRPEGIELNYLSFEPEEVFWRMVRYREFDVSELSLGSYIIRRSKGIDDLVAIPVFPSRMFRHCSIYVHAGAGISEAKDLIGKRIGVPEYQITAATWARGILEHEFGVRPRDVSWHTGGQRTPGRVEKQHINVGEGIHIQSLPEGHTLDQAIAAGEIDALIAPRHPLTFMDDSGRVKRLFPNFKELEQDWYRRTGIFPIMHTIAIRRDILQANPWAARSLMKAFEESKARVFATTPALSALKFSLPWLMDEWEQTEALMGKDFWPYGVEANRQNIATLIQYSYEQGLIDRVLEVDELFPESVGEDYKI
ncbi:MAG TPA: ABC transporter substrate-binding protein [Chloroflexota bacterium]|nr:ABC transporter substrate-binding protein [Chloroflexota bacterium]